MPLNQLSKRVALTLLAIMISILGVTGCMNKKPNPEEIKNKMMTYLQEKYGEEFVPMSLSFSDWAYSYDRLYAYPKKGTKQDVFEVWGTKMDDGSYSMSDGYFGIYIKPEYEKVMNGIVGEVYKDFKLYTNFGEGVMPDRLNKNTKIEEIYNKDEPFSSDTVIFVKQEAAKNINIDDSLVKIAEKMRDKKMVGFVRLYVVWDKKFESIGLDALKKDPLQNSELYLEEYKSVSVDSDLKIRKNGKEV